MTQEPSFAALTEQEGEELSVTPEGDIDAVLAAFPSFTAIASNPKFESEMITASFHSNGRITPSKVSASPLFLEGQPKGRNG